MDPFSLIGLISIILVVGLLGFVILLFWYISKQKKQIEAQKKIIKRLRKHSAKDKQSEIKTVASSEQEITHQEIGDTLPSAVEKAEQVKNLSVKNEQIEIESVASTEQENHNQETDDTFLFVDEVAIEATKQPSVKIEITPEFRSSLDLLEGDTQCIYVTGKAGTGKSTLLKYFVEHTKKPVALLAPTGMAALQVEGETIHSFFKFPGRTLTDEDINLSRNRKYRALETIIIDGISMVRVDLLDRINEFLMLNRDEKTKPFGGVQMIFFGDLYQLPPVVSGDEESQYIAANYDSPYFFDAKIMKQVELKILELTKVFRQKELALITALDQIRVNQDAHKALTLLNQRYIPAQNLGNERYTTLSSSNRIANDINQRNLQKIQSPVFTYKGRIEGELKEENLPAKYSLELKVDAQVLFVKNDPGGRWSNGTLGRVVELGEDYIQIEIQKDGENYIYSVHQEIWEIVKYTFDREKRKLKPEVVGKYIQYPLKLGWAITIHKSQGSTMERIHINLGKGAFAHGQTYVALSRCKSLEGVTLENPLQPADVIVDGKVTEFMAQYYSDGKVNTPQYSKFKDVMRHNRIPVQTKSSSKKHPAKKRAIEPDEEHKSGTPRGNLDWYVSDDVSMVIPLIGDRTHGIDLRSLPGSCDIYINGEFGWTANVSRIVAAQALWKATQQYKDVCIEPLGNYQSILIER